MDGLTTIDGLTETAPDTEPVTARLAKLLSSRPARSQDDLQDGISRLESAYSVESNKRLKLNIERALHLLKHGDEEDDD